MPVLLFVGLSILIFDCFWDVCFVCWCVLAFFCNFILNNLFY